MAGSADGGEGAGDRPGNGGNGAGGDELGGSCSGLGLGG